MDRLKMESGIRTFLEGLGLEEEAELGAVPRRVARAWAEDLLSGYATDPAEALTWTAVPPGGGPVLVRELSLASVCVHHLLPFFGFAHVAYLPHERQAGLSKIGRVVDAHARRLQTQERLAAAVAETLDRVLAPRGVLVLMQAEHTCMTLRGVRKERSQLATLASRGIYERDPDARREVLELLSTGR